MPAEIGTPQARRRKLFMLCDDLTLTKDDRLELASAILWTDVVSYKQLTDEQVNRMLDALEGASKVIWLLAERGRNQVVAQV